MTERRAETVDETVNYLRSLPAIRERCSQVFKLAQADKLQYFDYHPEREPDVVDYCAGIIERDFQRQFDQIPPHGRWRHFDVGSLPRITALLEEIGSKSLAALSPFETARKLTDLFMVSVLLDAGAGEKWNYVEKKTGARIRRSEGLAVASLDMFSAGVFAGEVQEEPQTGSQGVNDTYNVTATGLQNLTVGMIAAGLQVTPDENPMTGLEGRTQLLINLGAAIERDGHGYFNGPIGANVPALQRRPGFLVDYLASHPSTTLDAKTGQTTVQIATLWEVIIHGLAPIWPKSRTSVGGTSLGDVWPCPALSAELKTQGEDSPNVSLVPFHKLSQWLCYSLLEPLERTLGWIFEGGDSQTGLPEYRNGGLLVDLRVLRPTRALCELAAQYGPNVALNANGDLDGIPRLDPGCPAVVEWRAMTVILLDRIAEGIRTKFGLSKEQLNLKQVLEAATWKGGREIAKQLRPATGGPPIDIISDGTIF